MSYVSIIGLALQFLTTILPSFTKNAAPQEVIDAVNAAIVALQKHHTDLMSKADWESQRA